MQPFCIQIHVSDSGITVDAQPDDAAQSAGQPVQSIDAAIEAVRTIYQNGTAEAENQAESEFQQGFQGNDAATRFA